MRFDLDLTLISRRVAGNVEGGDGGVACAQVSCECECEAVYNRRRYVDKMLLSDIKGLLPNER
jgi:hypothetical protein